MNRIVLAHDRAPCSVDTSRRSLGYRSTIQNGGGIRWEFHRAALIVGVVTLVFEPVGY